MKRIEELTSRWLDGDLSDTERQELNQLLQQDAETVGTCLALLRLEGDLIFDRAESDPACGRTTERVMARIGEALEQRAEAHVMEAIQQRCKGTIPFRRPILPSWIPWALAASLAILAGGYYLFFSQGRPIATLEAAPPGVTLERNHDTIQVVKSESLRAGDTVRVGPGAGAVIRYADSTQLKIGADSVLTLQPDKSGTKAGKWVEIRQGNLSASVAKQPAGRPMVFVTPTAEATVLGTRLHLRVEENSTRLVVEHGAVRLRRLADDQAVTVSQGEQAVVATDSSIPLAATSVTNNPGGATTLYSNDMETAITYRSGTLVTTPAPHGGLKSEQRPANATNYGSSTLNLALPASVNNFTYSVWVTDNNHPTQTYRIYIKFKNPTTGAFSLWTGTPPTAAGASWTRLSGNFTSIVNQRIGEGYTQLHRIYLRAWPGKTTAPGVPYYADDVLVEYQ